MSGPTVRLSIGPEAVAVPFRGSVDVVSAVPFWFDGALWAAGVSHRVQVEGPAPLIRAHGKHCGDATFTHRQRVPLRA